MKFHFSLPSNHDSLGLISDIFILGDHVDVEFDGRKLEYLVLNKDQTMGSPLCRIPAFVLAPEIVEDIEQEFFNGTTGEEDPYEIWGAEDRF